MRGRFHGPQILGLRGLPSLGSESPTLSAPEGPGDPWTIGPWVAGSNTTLSIVGGRARATSSNGGHPRISRLVTGLEPGATYRVQTTIYRGTSISGLGLRAAGGLNLIDEEIYNYEDLGIPDSRACNLTFKAPLNYDKVYIGIALSADSAGQYGEVDDTLTLSRVSDAPSDMPVVGPWFAGTNTVLTLVSERARCAAVGVNNPRVIRQITGLKPGTEYRVVTDIYRETMASTIYFRIDSSDPNLGGSDIWGGAMEGHITINFYPPSNGSLYLGMVGVATADGQYAEIGETVVSLV